MTSWIEHSRKPYWPQHQAVGLNDIEVLELIASFRLCGYWRFDLDTGHLFGTPDFTEIFGMAPSSCPLNVVELSSTIHPDDLSVMMETFERASAARLTYHNLYRVKAANGLYKFVRSVGRFRTSAASQGEVIGMTYELFDQESTTIGFIAGESPSPPPAEGSPSA